MNRIEIRKITNNDINLVIDLYRIYSKSQLSKELVKDCFQKYPALILEVDGSVQGFAYCGRFAPDILELRNIFISDKYRSAGLGSKLLKEIEQLSFQNFKGLILVNSTLYPVNVEKKSPKNFYIKNEYKLIMSTPDSDVYSKVG